MTTVRDSERSRGDSERQCTALNCGRLRCSFGGLDVFASIDRSSSKAAHGGTQGQVVFVGRHDGRRKPSCCFTVVVFRKKKKKKKKKAL